MMPSNQLTRRRLVMTLKGADTGLAIAAADTDAHRIVRARRVLRMANTSTGATCSLPRVDRIRSRGCPMLVLGASEDRIVSPIDIENTAAAYGAACRIFPAMGPRHDAGRGMAARGRPHAPMAHGDDWLSIWQRDCRVLDPRQDVLFSDSDDPSPEPCDPEITRVAAPGRSPCACRPSG